MGEDVLRGCFSGTGREKRKGRWVNEPARMYWVWLAGVANSVVDALSPLRGGEGVPVDSATTLLGRRHCGITAGCRGAEPRFECPESLGRKSKSLGTTARCFMYLEFEPVINQTPTEKTCHPRTTVWLLALFPLPHAVRVTTAWQVQVLSRL